MKKYPICKDCYKENLVMTTEKNFGICIDCQHKFLEQHSFSELEIHCRKLWNRKETESPAQELRRVLKE